MYHYFENIVSVADFTMSWQFYDFVEKKRKKKADGLS